MTDPTAPRDLTYEERATLQDLYAWSDRLTDDWLGLGERLRGYADAWKADVDELRAEVERLTGERDEARKPPHCINCHCEESAKGMVDLSDYLDLHRGLMAVVYESKSHAEAVLFSECALRHAESEHVISEAASSATAPNSFADQNRALVAEVANRRGITLGHLREDGGGELAQIMRRLDKAECMGEVAPSERLANLPKRAYYETHDPPHCPTCECGR